MERQKTHMARHDGKVAIVTGASGGIGQAVAVRLAADGAEIALFGQNVERLEATAAKVREQGRRAECFQVDSKDPEAIEAAVAKVQQAWSRIDILVNNAVLSPWRAIEDTDPAIFAKAVEVDLRGYWYMSVEAAKRMKRDGGGSIVNIASLAALHPDRMLGLYSTLKTALIGMSRSFALEFGKEGVRVNTVLPGLFLTKLADAYDDDARRRICEKAALGRLGDPDEIGYAVLYLSSAAGAYVTGASLVVDGGLSIASL